jgi:hypothetical protein
MFRARASRALGLLVLCAVLSLGSLWAVRFAQARGKPTADGSDTNATVVGATSSTALVAPAPLPPPGASLSTSERVLPVSKPGDVAEPVRVLLVGNSYTMHHSLHQMLERVAKGVEGGPALSADAVAHGGYSLRNHLRTGLALQRIRAGHYTHVVLQGHSLSAVDHPSELAQDAERFKQVIDAAAGRTVFYATWARSPEVSLYRTHKQVHSFEEMSTRVSSTYFDLSSKLGAALAPVGSAFEHALVTHPKLSLWGSDGSHPSLAGSYMAACVLYGAITGRDPSSTRFVPKGLPEADARLVREVAMESLAAHGGSVSEAAAVSAAPGPT